MMRRCGILSCMLPLVCMPVVSCVSETVMKALPGYEEVSFTVDCAGGFTRSSLSADENSLNSLKILAYADGILDAEGYFTSREDISMRLVDGKVYDFYALANIGDMEAPLLESEVSEMVCPVPVSSGLSGAFPMAWSVAGREIKPGSSVNIGLSRLVAKITLDVDCGDTGLSVVSASLKQTPFTVRPFAASGSKASDDGTSSGDHTSDADVKALNAGRTACFYMFENMQGTLLPGNKDPMRKVLDGHPDKAEVCTYLEVTCAFDEGDDREGSVSYRMYLGKDNVTNFDVERNHIVSLSLKLTDEGVGIRDSWKVVSDYVQHVTAVRLDRTSLEMFVGEEGFLNVEVLPYDAEDKDVMWVSDDPEVAAADEDGGIVAIGKGQCLVRAVSCDRPEIYAECLVTVSEPVITGIAFDRPVVTAILPYDGGGRESSFDVVATYSDGSRVLVTGSCSYNSDSPGACVTAPGTVAHVAEGTACITASLDGETASLEVRTEACVLSGLELNEKSVILTSGETFALKFRALFNDGAYTPWIAYGGFNGFGLSADGWKSDDYAVADVGMSGAVRALGTGSTSVSITVGSNGGERFTASASVAVREAYVTEIYVDMSPMFYSGSSGPVLMGVYNDGSVSALKADRWETSNPYVAYSESGGLVVSDESGLSEGVSMCSFKAVYGTMTASAVSKYGKWVRGAALEKTWTDGRTCLLRMYVVMDDFTRRYVKFRYICTDHNGVSGDAGTSDESGVKIDSRWVSIEAETSSPHYDSSGGLRLWEAEWK